MCLFTCCCTWNQMFDDHLAFHLCWNTLMPDYCLWLSREARYCAAEWRRTYCLYFLCCGRVSEFFLPKLWPLSAMFDESWSEFPLTSSLLCHPLLHLKIRACAWLWFNEAVVFVSPKRLLVTPPCCHLWTLSAGSGCYFWGSLWTERAQISTAWSSQPPMGTLEGWDATLSSLSSFRADKQLTFLTH